MIKSGLTVQSYDPKVIRLKTPCPQCSGHNLCPFCHMCFFSGFASLFRRKKKVPKNNFLILSEVQKNFSGDFELKVTHWGAIRAGFKVEKAILYSLTDCRPLSTNRPQTTQWKTFNTGHSHLRSQVYAQGDGKGKNESARRPTIRHSRFSQGD
jgi:hypothetical protein